MKINIRGRVRNLGVKVQDTLNTVNDDIRVSCSGDTEITLTQQELRRILLSQVPFDRAARDRFFAVLRAEADAAYPCERPF